VSQFSNLKPRYKRMNIADSRGDVVARTIVFAGKDGGNQDFNGLFLSIRAWKYAW
jgi:hypothetical protein